MGVAGWKKQHQNEGNDKNKQVNKRERKIRAILP